MCQGYAGGELHGWNIVKLGKYYYNLDATWDSENYQKGCPYKNFLKGDIFDNHIRFAKYKSSEFYSNYPMAKLDYGKGKKILSSKSKVAKFKAIKPKFAKIKGDKVTLRKIGSGVKCIVKYATNKKYYICFRGVKVIRGKTVYTKWSRRKKLK